MQAGAARTIVVLLLGCAGLLSGCRQETARVDPATAQESAFSGGSCLVLADQLIVLRAVADQILLQDPVRAAIDPAIAAFLQEEVGRFRQGLRLASEQVTGPLTVFVAALQDLNTRLAAGTQDTPALLRRVLDAADDLIQACT